MKNSKTSCSQIVDAQVRQASTVSIITINSEHDFIPIKEIDTARF